MTKLRREFLKLAGSGLAGGAAAAILAPGAHGQAAPMPPGSADSTFDVKRYGAKGDGSTIDTAAINRAIEAANAAGGGTVRFPAGVYASYSIHLKSNVALYLEAGATILAAEVPEGGAASGASYDPAEPNAPWESYQDYGHNHWHNSLIWGEGLHDVAILGPGLIWGKGLSRGGREFPRAETPGMGNKAIALKNCHNVLLRDFSILKGGHFGILATGVDNLTIDNLKIDTDRDGMDIDCCRNVRVSNCSVNSPWDDGICPKSSFALGYARATENLTITNCYVTGAYVLGTTLDGTWKRWPPDFKVPPTGRIKCGTESNGGFKNITISNCVFDGCRGFALESVDGALLEDITFTGVTMRDCTNTPIFLRLGSRMRGPAGVPVGTLKRIIISNVVSYNSMSQFGGAGLILGIPGHPIEDIKINDLYMEHRGGGTKAMAAHVVEEQEQGYPEPSRFGDIPASGFFVRHVNNIEFTNVEIAWSQPDARPVFSLTDVNGAEFYRLKTPKGQSSPLFALHNVEDFSVMASRNLKDMRLDKTAEKVI
ncbi:MAG TPA: glycoside hydrolase family 28 protein [Acidobacteriaceae bacterium]|nr:glycoside hydrolase family 28 protein [Acidobacteriaceae bacterium]